MMARGYGYGGQDYDTSFRGASDLPGMSAVADAIETVRRQRALDEQNVREIQALAQQRVRDMAYQQQEQQRMRWEQEKYLTEKRDSDFQGAMKAIEAGLSVDDAMALYRDTPGERRPVLANYAKVVKEQREQEALEKKATALRPMLEKMIPGIAAAPGMLPPDQIARIAEITGQDPEVVFYALYGAESELAEKERVRLEAEAGKWGRAQMNAAATGALNATQREIAIDRLRRTARQDMARWEEPLAQGKGALESDAAVKPGDKAGRRSADAQILLGMARLLNPVGTLATFDVDITRGNLPWPFSMKQVADRVLRGSGILTDEERAFMKGTLERRIRAVEARRTESHEYVRRGAERIGVPVEEILPPVGPQSEPLPAPSSAPAQAPAQAPAPTPGGPVDTSIPTKREARAAVRALRASGVKEPTAEQIAEMIRRQREIGGR